jgi:hypothetical protein
MLTGCQAEKEAVNESTNRIKNGKTQIGFEDFKRETNLNDFKTSIKVNAQSTFARTANGGYDLTDFDVDTNIIKRLELDDKVTYTFRILPKIIISPNSFYNLTMHYKDGQWVESIVELKPTLENFDSLLSGSTSTIDGKASILYTSDTSLSNSNNNCYSVGIINSSCEDPEVISDDCAIKKHTTFCFQDNVITLGNESDIYPNSTSMEYDYSFMLNTNDLKKNLDEFARKHVLLGNQIATILDNEEHINFDNFPFQQLEASQSTEEFKLAIANTGIVKHQELFNLLMLQNQNGIDFAEANKDFSILKPETRELLLSDAIDNAIEQNPIVYVPPGEPGNTTLARTCAQQYQIDRQRCFKGFVGNLALSIASTGFINPIGFAIGGAISLAIAANCASEAREDYYDCLN